MSDDFSFTMAGDDKQQRRAFRASVPGLEVYIPARDARYKVGDLSALGLAFLDESRSFKEGEALELDMFLNRKLFLSGLKLRVMRVLDKGIIGCNFEAIDPRKEARLDKLVLEVQKRLIALRKAAKKKA